MGDVYADGAETDSFLDNGELSVVVTAPLCPGDASKAIRNGNATAMLKNTRVRSVVPTPAVSSVSVVPTPAVSYIVCRPNTRRQLQCLSSQHLPSATVCVVPTPAISYSRSSQHPLSAQCVSSQQPPSATATEPLIDLASAAVTYASVRSQLRLLVWPLITGLTDQSL